MQVAAAAQKVTAAHEGLLVFLLNLPLSLPALAPVGFYSATVSYTI